MFGAHDRAIGCFLWVALLSTAENGSAQPTLPVYLEDSHAGSFYWSAENLDWSREYTLVLFDAHSDATQLFDSDIVREKLERLHERAPLLADWRERGVIQCFNWIEPLMPRPFARVVWVVPPERDLEGAAAEVARELDAHEQVAPRNSGSLRERFEVMRESDLGNVAFERPVIVSLDLDFFAEAPSSEIADRFDATWDTILSIPRLTALTAAVSTPYLSSREQTIQLVSLFFERSYRLVNSEVRFEPFAETGPDWKRGALARIRIDDRGNIVETRMIPIRLDERGFPEIEESSRSNDLP